MLRFLVELNIPNHQSRLDAITALVESGYAVDFKIKEDETKGTKKYILGVYETVETTVRCPDGNPVQSFARMHEE